MFIIFTIIAELVFVSILILSCYRLKSWFGLTPLYVFIGASQFFQTILITSFPVNILGGLSISVNSNILFSASLFAILLLYIKEGVAITQKFIFSIVLANFSITILTIFAHQQELAIGVEPSNLFLVNFRVFFVGTVVLILDAFLLVILYEFIITRLKWLSLFGRLFFSLFIILNFDAIAFTIGAFWDHPDLSTKVLSQLVGKSSASLFFAIVLFLYLRFFDKKRFEEPVDRGKVDIFSILTYKGRFEKLQTEKAISDEYLQNIIDVKNIELEKSVRRFSIMASLRELRMDEFTPAEQAGEFLKKVQEAFEIDACCIYLLVQDKLEVLSCVGAKKDELDQLREVNTPFLKSLVLSKTFLVIEDAAKDPAIIKAREAGLLKFMYQSCAGATMMIGNQVMGILKLYATKEKRIFTSLELEHLQLIANQLVNSIENNRLFEQNEKQKEILVKQIIARKKIEEEIKQNAEQLRQLTTHLQNIREEERKRIGREIHDDLGQQLTAIKMDVAWIDKKTTDESSIIKPKLKNIISLLNGSNVAVRKILNELRADTLDNYALVDALEWQGQQFTANTGIPVLFSSSHPVLKTEEAMAICIYRAYQEALTNITRYAKAKKVISSITYFDENITLKIKDDGKGFDTTKQKNKQSFGLLGMKERVTSLNGTFKIISSPGKGTTIMISLPFKM